jgi:hypothetical protein
LHRCPPKIRWTPSLRLARQGGRWDGWTFTDQRRTLLVRGAGQQVCTSSTTKMRGGTLRSSINAVYSMAASRSRPVWRIQRHEQLPVEAPLLRCQWLLCCEHVDLQPPSVGVELARRVGAQGVLDDHGLADLESPCSKIHGMRVRCAQANNRSNLCRACRARGSSI